MQRNLAAVLLCLLVAGGCDRSPTVTTDNPLVLEVRAFSPGIGVDVTNDFCLLRAVLPIYTLPTEWSGVLAVQVVRMRRVDGQLRTVYDQIEQAASVRIRSTPDSTHVIVGGVAADSLSGRTWTNQAEGQWICPSTFPGGESSETQPVGSWRLGVFLPD